MGNLKVVLNHDGFREYLNSDGVHQLVLNEAQIIADRASAGVANSEGYKATSLKAGSRWIAFASTTDTASIQAESEDKVLSRAVIPHGN